MTTPGQILTELINNFGWQEFTVEAVSEDRRVSATDHDLGNGNIVYGFVSDTHDGVYVYPGEELDLSSTSFGDWDNLSRFYTGQHGSPEDMHDSEYVGGKLAEDIARVPGEYATPYVAHYPEGWEDEESFDYDYEGWLMLYRDIFDTEESH